MKIINIIPIRKNIKQADAIKDIISADEYIKILFPLKIFQDTIQEIKDKAKTSVSKVLNIITGQDATMANIANGILKIAFNSGAVYQLPGQDGYRYDLSSVNYRGGDPNKDKTTARTREILYGETNTISLSTMKAWVSDTESESTEERKETILSMMPSFSQPVLKAINSPTPELPPRPDADYAKLIFKIYGKKAAIEKINSLAVEDPDAKIKNFLNFYEDIVLKANTAEKELKDYIRKTPKKLLDTPGHRVSMEEAENYKQKIMEEREILASKVQNYHVLRKATARHFDYSPLDKVQEAGYNPKGGFLNWDGNADLFNEYLSKLEMISNKKIFVDFKEQEKNRLEQEIKKVESSMNMRGNEKNARLIELNEKKNFPEAILSSYKGETNKSIFNKEYCKYILSTIKNVIKPTLLQISEVNEIEIAPITNELIRLFDTISNSLSPKLKRDGSGKIIPSEDVVDKNAKYEVVDSYFDKIVELNKKLNVIFNNTPRALILNNFEKNSNVCQEKDKSNQKQSKNEVASAQRNGTSGQDGDYLVRDAGVLDRYHDKANVKGKKEQIKKVLVIPSTRKIDFQHVIQKGYGGISYIDLRNFLTVDEEIGEALIKYFVANKTIKIRASSAKAIGSYLIGRSISSAVEIIKESLNRCKNTAISENGRATIDPKCIADICEDISYKDAESISPLLVKVKPKLATEEFVTSIHNSQLGFVNKQLTQAMIYRELSLEILKIEDEIEELQDELTAGKETLDIGIKKTLETEIVRLTHLKWKKEIAYESGNKLDSESNFYCLTGGSATGKTEWPKIVAQEFGWSYYQTDLNKVKNKYVGESERRLHEFMEAVLRMRNTIINFDEIDGQFFTPSTGGTSVDQSNTGMRTALQSFFEDHIDDFKAKNIIFYGSTNNWAAIAKAFKSRIKRQEFENAIQRDTIEQIIRSSHLHVLRIMGVENPENLVEKNYANPIEPETEETRYKKMQIVHDWQELMNKIEALSPEGKNKIGEQIMASHENIDFRYINNLALSIHSGDRHHDCLKGIIDAFYNDNTQNKDKWAALHPVFYKRWASRGKPENMPIQGYKGIEANSENLVRQYKTTSEKIQEQDTGAININLKTGQDEIIKEQVEKSFGLRSPEEEKKEDEQLKLDLGLTGNKDLIEPTGTVPTAPSVGSVGEAESAKSDADVDITPNKTKQKLPPKKQVPSVLQEEQQEEQEEQQEEQEEQLEDVKSSTDYFYNFLKKQGFFQQNTAPIATPDKQKSAQFPVVKHTVSIDDVKYPFSIGDMKFVPFNL